MPARLESLRHQIPDAYKWGDLQELYKDIHFTTEPAEAVEAYGVGEHNLGNRLFNLQTFWRYHVAPATHRTLNNHLAVDVAEVITHIAQRNYEVYANICDALDELNTIKKDGPKPPRYRSCLNVLRCVGDACSLFDDLIRVLGEKSDISQRTKKAKNLATGLGVNIYLFKDWDEPHWSKERMYISDYRHMLVHHGRPWLFFNGPEHNGWPFILQAEHSRLQTEHSRDPGSNSGRGVYLTWNQQKNLFSKDRSKFVLLPEACKKTCDDGIKWLNRALAGSTLDWTKFCRIAIQMKRDHGASRLNGHVRHKRFMSHACR